MPFEVVSKQIKKTREEILAGLQVSLQKNNAIGIILKDTNELITTAVTEIEDDLSGDFIVSLQDHDLHGFPLQRNRLLLSNIESIINFNIPFDDVEYVKVRRKEKFFKSIA
jgi:hypothetical protein